MASSRFVSEGTDEAPTERGAAWSKAEREVEQKRREKLESEKQGGNNGPSLYETLQANKVAKQDAFEEAAKLKNQFPTLDEAEVEFLHSAEKEKLDKERKVKAQTAADLALFRQQRDEAEKAELREGVVEAAPDGDDMWKVGPRKRKKGKQRELIGGIKIRNTSTAEEKEKEKEKEKDEAQPKAPKQDGPEADAAEPEKGDMPAATTKSALASESLTAPPVEEKKSASPPAKPGLGLADYSSDED